MKYKVKNREEFKKIQQLFPERLIFFNSYTCIIDVENRNDSDEVLIKRISVLLKHKQKEDLREDIIFRLKSLSLSTPIEPFVNALIKHYKTEIDLFIKDGTDDFMLAVETEPETIGGNPNPYYQYLEIVVEAPDEKYPTGKKVRDSILEQIRFSNED